MANLAERNIALPENETKNSRRTAIQDYLIIFASYIVFYSFLIGYSLVLLLGAMKTSNEGTVLWSFFISGVLFYMMVAIAIYLGSRERRKQDKMEEENKLDSQLIEV